MARPVGSSSRVSWLAHVSRAGRVLSHTISHVRRTECRTVLLSLGRNTRHLRGCTQLRRGHGTGVVAHVCRHNSGRGNRMLLFDGHVRRGRGRVTGGHVARMGRPGLFHMVVHMAVYVTINVSVSTNSWRMGHMRLLRWLHVRWLRMRRLHVRRVLLHVRRHVTRLLRHTTTWCIPVWIWAGIVPRRSHRIRVVVVHAGMGLPMVSSRVGTRVRARRRVVMGLNQVTLVLLGRGLGLVLGRSIHVGIVMDTVGMGGVTSVRMVYLNGMSRIGTMAGVRVTVTITRMWLTRMRLTRMRLARMGLRMTQSRVGTTLNRMSSVGITRRWAGHVISGHASSHTHSHTLPFRVVVEVNQGTCIGIQARGNLDLLQFLILTRLQ